jgi:hypothetical protein
MIDLSAFVSLSPMKIVPLSDGNGPDSTGFQAIAYARLQGRYACRNIAMQREPNVQSR